ncbi:MAG: oligopeptide/dipeptide ABC transporter ATP-binding protein [Acutalibacteraceae bacterium]
MNSYPFELSGGMNQRVAIALAMILNPQLLLADEPTSALDVTVQAQCVKEMMDLRQHLGTTIIIVTHNMGVVSHMADKVAVMYAGSIVEYGSKADVLNHPKHPYTKALIASIPQIGGTIPKGIPGQPPAFGEVFTGCSFSPRCSLCDNICTHEKPVMHSGENGHAVFCHKCLSEV